MNHSSANTTPESNEQPPVRNGPSESHIHLYVQIVKGQTDMPEEDIIDSLKRHNYDIVKVVREYIKGDCEGKGKGSETEQVVDDSKQMQNVQLSTNQLRFNEIRSFMDKASESFRKNQEMNRIYQHVMEKKKAQAAAAAAAAASTQDTQETQPPENQNSKL